MRIIAGQYRGRRLACPKHGTRPTLDRVREALFSILGDIEGQKVVDLYAGSGALGLEAVSRGAEHATIVEADRAACAVIRRNAAHLGCRNVTVVEGRVEDVRARLQAVGPFDLVLSDPPWAIAAEALEVVARAVKGCLAPDAWVVVGHAARECPQIGPGLGLEVLEDRTWGDSGLLFLRRAAP